MWVDLILQWWSISVFQNLFGDLFIIRNWSLDSFENQTEVNMIQKFPHSIHLYLQKKKLLITVCILSFLFRCAILLQNLSKIAVA